MVFNKYFQDGLNISLQMSKKNQVTTKYVKEKKSAICIFAETIEKSVYLSILEHIQNPSKASKYF